VAHDGASNGSAGKIPFLVESNKQATRTVVALDENQRLYLSEISLQEVDSSYGYRVSGSCIQMAPMQWQCILSAS
jgi:hypothetical protein